MSRPLATVELVQNDDGTITARVKPHVAELGARVRRAVDALADALSEGEDELGPEEWEREWSDEIARRRRAIADGSMKVVSLDDFRAQLDAATRSTR